MEYAKVKADLNGKARAETSLPADGWAGFKQYWQSDALSGMMVFLLAMPLSLGIAKASDFPAIYGILTAIIGGLVVSFFAGSKLTIKGPAAGLIVICAEAVAEFGGGTIGWQLALGAIVVAGAVQILFGLMKLGRFSSFVPNSAIHGMLAAIGIIIFSKQVHTLLGIDPSTLKGKGTWALLGAIPNSLATLDHKAALIGFISLAIIFGWPLVKASWAKMVPAPLLVLLVAVPLEIQMDFRHTEPAFTLIHLGNVADVAHIHASFEGIAQLGTFIKFVVLFALIGSIESLLTVKAIDNIDPFGRKSDYNRDLLAVGVGNMLSGLFGGLPMISEVARSTANVANGAKTRWANFFHGAWLLVFVVFAQPFIEMIPNAALAAMLMLVAWKLANPKEFKHAFHVGMEQGAVFLATVLITLSTDLLVGVLSGIALEICINIVRAKGAIGHQFSKGVAVEERSNGEFYLKLTGSATFTNYQHIEKEILALPAGSNMTIDFTGVHLADHTILRSLSALESAFAKEGRSFLVVGLEEMKAMGADKSSARIRPRPGFKMGV